MFPAVTDIVTTSRGNAEMRSAARSQQRPKAALGWLLLLWESVMAEGLPIHVFWPSQKLL